MAVLGEQEAILFTVPRGFGSGDQGETKSVATGPSSSGSQAITGAIPAAGFIGTSGFWYTWVAEDDCYIRIGGSDVAACTANDWPLFKGQEWNRWIRIGIDTNFTVIQKISASVVKHGRSSQ